MSSLQRRKSQPQASQLEEAVELLRELVELQRQTAADTAAIKAMMEAAAQPAPVDNEAPTPHEVIDQIKLIDQTQFLTPKQAAAIAGKDATTMRRWLREYDIGVTFATTTYIDKTKLLARIAKRSPD